MPAISALKVGLTDEVEDKVAVLPDGLVVSDHALVKGSLLASELALPSSVTTVPTTTFCATPAFATGAALEMVAVMLALTGALLTLPSFTKSVATYVPAMSASKVGLADVDEDRLAVLPVGFDERLQLKVKGSPLASLALPSSVTVVPASTFCVTPAFATGATLVGDTEGPDGLSPPPPHATSAKSRRTPKMAFMQRVHS